MLYSRRVLIATPPKTGARSLEAAANESRDFSRSGSLHSVLLKGKAWDPHQPKDIILMVREPYARLVSMWSFNRRNPVDWRPQDKALLRDCTLPQFITWLSLKRNEAMENLSPLDDMNRDVHPLPWRWVLSLAETRAVAELNGYRVWPWRTEDMGLLPEYLERRWGMKMPEIPRRNTSDKVLGEPIRREDAKGLFSESMVKRSRIWLADSEAFGYH